jgi:chitin disaccharide deacetylase
MILNLMRITINKRKGILRLLLIILISASFLDYSVHYSNIKPVFEMQKQLLSSIKQTVRHITYGNIQKRLGYPKDTKLLIIHADDLGITASENEASTKAFQMGMVNSGSIMVTCSKFNDIADFSRSHPEADIGIHLTITSEWNSHKWGPVLPPEKVKSIVDSNGYFFYDKGRIIENANPEEVDKEFRAQFNKAIQSGIELTHIDTHMLTAFSSRDILRKYIELGKEYKLPVLLTNELPLNTWLFKKALVVDKLYCAQPEDYVKGLDNYYSNTLKSIKPGLNIILVHIAFNDDEMQDLTGNNPNFGATWRQNDYDFFISDECRQLIKENNIRLITWREIRDKLTRKIVY